MLMALDVSNMNIDIGVMDGYDIKYRFKMAAILEKTRKPDVKSRPILICWPPFSAIYSIN